MTDGPEVARAYATIIPSMEGSQAKIATDLTAAISPASKKAGTAVGADLAASASSALGKFAVPAAVGAAAVAVTAELFKIGESYDVMYDSIARGTGATGELLEDLNQSARNVYSRVPASLEEVGDALAELNTRTGATGETLEKMSEQFLQLDVIGYSADIDTVTGAFNAWNISTDDMSDRLDDLFTVSQSTGASIDTLASATGKNAATMEQLGFTFEETAALAGQLDKAGLDASGMLGKLGKACVDMAKDGQAPAEAYQDIVNRLKDFIAQGDEAAALDLASEVFGTKGAAQFLQAVETGAVDVESLTAAMGENSDAIKDNYDRTKDYDQALEELKHNAENLLEPLGSAVFTTFSDVLKAMADGSKELSGFVGDLSDKLSENEELTSALSDAGDILGGTFDSLASFGSTVGGVISDIAKALGLADDDSGDMASTIAGVLIPAVKTAGTVIETFKGGIDLAADAIQFFRDLFNGELKFPHIAIPHFNITGGEIPWGIGGLGTAPTVSVDWYAKGGIADGARLIGVGEAGPEAIMPLQGRYMRPFADAVASNMGGAGATVILNGATLNDDARMRQVTQLFLNECMRKAAI